MPFLGSSWCLIRIQNKELNRARARQEPTATLPITAGSSSAGSCMGKRKRSTVDTNEANVAGLRVPYGDEKEGNKRGNRRGGGEVRFHRGACRMCSLTASCAGTGRYRYIGSDRELLGRVLHCHEQLRMVLS